jgi:hypothetical protein
LVLRHWVARPQPDWADQKILADLPVRRLCQAFLAQRYNVGRMLLERQPGVECLRNRTGGLEYLIPVAEPVYPAFHLRPHSADNSRLL